ncbi:MAG: hypothetical protein HZB33_10515 [Nitrospirae bacterium]|nr:hypothetical protein [Nitrospirota bacterium]
MFLTSFAHRDRLFRIAERWFSGRAEPEDVRSLTEILICDVYIVRETLDVLSRRLLEMIYPAGIKQEKIRFKGELRDLLCRDSRETTPRVASLLSRYLENPDYYYRETPINASVLLDEKGHLLGSYRVKRPKRIAEKANRRIADWIFGNVLDHARQMALARAEQSGVPLEQFMTPPEEMAKEFIAAEEVIAGRFRDGTIEFDRNALMIQDVGALKIVADDDTQQKFTTMARAAKDIKVLEQEQFSGNFRATNMIFEVAWDAEHVCRRYKDEKAWERYKDRGIPAEDLGRGLEPLLKDAEPRISIEVILTTFPDLVESELGSSIHEERIIAQRDNKYYKGYIPMNVEFLVEFLFAVGFSPRDRLEEVPIKVWGRYLPETLGSYIRKLYALPDHDFFG